MSEEARQNEQVTVRTLHVEDMVRAVGNCGTDTSRDETERETARKIVGTTHRVGNCEVSCSGSEVITGDRGDGAPAAQKEG